MLTETVVIVVVTLVASGLAILGVLDLLWPAPSRPARQASAQRSAAPPTEAPLLSAPESVVELAPAPESEPMPDEPAGSVAATAAAENEASPTSASLVEICLALHDAGRFDEVVSTATPALVKGGAGASPDAARLWSLLGRARWALHDGDGAREALQAAVQASPEDARDSYERQLRSIALVAADDLLVRSRDAVEEQERLSLLRAAREWLRAGGPQGVSSRGPRDAAGEEVDTLLAGVEEVYWPACESRVRVLLAEKNFREAHRLASEALGDERVPAERREAFRQLDAEALAAEIGDLTASAVESMREKREWDALRALERAEELSKSIGTLPPERRDGIARSLWWAYTRLGVARVEAEEYEQALDPLFRALRVQGIDPDKRDETRWAMVRALDGLVQSRAATIRDVIAAGHGDAAVVQAERLWKFLRSGIAAGAPQEALARALATSRQLLEDLGQAPT